ncbi:hypothetical protein JKP88DRAFT_250960 [Tribonema minus]|uniref:Peptidase M12B domain-containing protein n=1 Tax=Tribonema minus TaxID=303371 RepID=A0A835ZFU9_9STRA|nr:hypothetical protein JKP88DRAFT_250960 [Tribonema minus]
MASRTGGAAAVLWLLFALDGAAAAGNPPVLKSAEVALGCTRNGVPTNAADAAKPQSASDVARNKLCQADVVAKFDTVNKNARGMMSNVFTAPLASCRCCDFELYIGYRSYTVTSGTTMMLDLIIECTTGSITSFSAVEGVDYIATKTRSQEFPQLDGVKTWLGEVKGQPGALATIAWDKTCNASKFYMDVKMPSVVSAAATSFDSNIDMVATQLKAVPCSGSNNVANCVWLAEVETALPKAVARQVPASARRHLEERDDQELEDDLELLAAMQRGDADARDHFVRYGGRRLESDGAVIMPSGRRLDDGSVVTLMYVYGNYTKARWGSQVPSMVAAGVNSANLVLTNSGVNFQFQLVNLMYSDYADNNMNTALNRVCIWERVNPAIHSRTTSRLYTAIATCAPCLNLKFARDVPRAAQDMVAGTVPGVAAARNTYGADLIQQYGNSAVLNDCFTPTGLTHAHEIGHNMGCHHDMGTDGSGAASGSLWPYSFGYRYCSTPSYRTVMAYGCTTGYAARAPYYSSPNVYYLGYPTGTTAEDNVRTLNDSKLTVSNFRLNGSTPTATPTSTPTSKPTTTPTQRRSPLPTRLLLSPPLSLLRSPPPRRLLSPLQLRHVLLRCSSANIMWHPVLLVSLFDVPAYGRNPQTHHKGANAEAVRDA